MNNEQESFCVDAHTDIPALRRHIDRQAAEITELTRQRDMATEHRDSGDHVIDQLAAEIAALKEELRHARFA